MTAWRMEALGSLGMWHGGGTPSKHRSEFWEGGDIPWLSPKDMRDSVLRGTRDHITEAAVANSAVRVVDPGSVAVVVRSGILERTIPVAIVPFATTLNQDMKALTPRPGVDARWVAWGVRAYERDLLRHARKAGTTVASLEWGRFLTWKIPVPPLDEQRRIVEILEDHLSRLDAAENYLEAALKRLRRLEAAVLSSLASVTDPTASLGSLAVSSGYGTSTRCVVGGPGPAVVRIPNLRNGTIDLVDEKRAADASVDLSAVMLQAGDLLIVRTNGSKDLIGRTAVVQEGIAAAFASYLIRFQFDPTQVVPEWAHLMLARQSARRTLEELAASSAGQYNLSLKKLHSVEIPMPRVDEQLRRIAEHRATTGPLDALANAAIGSHRRAESLRRALLAAAFSGRLTGRSSDADIAEQIVASEGVFVR